MPSSFFQFSLSSLDGGLKFSLASVRSNLTCSGGSYENRTERRAFCLVVDVGDAIFCPGTGPGSRVYQGEGWYLRLCGQGRELDLQRRIDRGRTGDYRHLPKAARHAPVDGRREEA